MPTPTTPIPHNTKVLVRTIRQEKDKRNPSGKKRIVAQLTIHWEEKGKRKLLLPVLQHQTYSNGLKIFILLFILYCSYPVNNVLIVSSELQRGSAINTHVSILPQTPHPSRLPPNTEQSSLCWTAGKWTNFF